MQLSIIIPTYKEREHLPKLLDRLVKFRDSVEIIVVDANSEDGTDEVAGHYGVQLVTSTIRSRAHQMNLGVRRASGDVFYFVHADTLPPKSFHADIREALNEGYDMGCYRFQFDSPSRLLRINSYFTRFRFLWCRGGDQSLFVKRDTFSELEGFREEFVIMEEYDLFKRARSYRMKVIPKDILVSARKYDRNSYLRVQFANLLVFNLFRLGAEPARIRRTYHRLLTSDHATNH